MNKSLKAHNTNTQLKNYGSFFEYEQERNADLIRAYREDISSCKVIRLSEVWQRIANMPSARFWVSEERAAIVVAKMMHGDKLEGMRPLKREMFFEIFRRVKKLRAEYPDVSIYKCCIRVVSSPAPKFYMTPLSIRETIYKIKRSWYKERRSKSKR